MGWPAVSRGAWWTDPRSVVLLALAVYFARITVLYSPLSEGQRTTALPVALAEVASKLPLLVYGVMWLLSAIFLVVVAVVHIRFTTRLSLVLGMVVGMFMPTLWGWFYLIGWTVAGFDNQEWNTSLAYFVTAVIVGGTLLSPPTHRVVHP